MNTPDGINQRAQALWDSVTQDYNLADHQFHILRRLVETITAVDDARKIIDRDGPTYINRFGDPHERPEVGIVRNGVSLERGLTRDLYLDPDEEDEA